MSSVSLDVFSMPAVTWEGSSFNGYLMCVDRHSGWMVAKPVNKTEGFTGRMAATLLLESSWGEMAIPSVITSDQGPEFVSQWWETMCNRLGIRQAFSQAHHHQANGRAEVAGRVLQGMLRRLHAQGHVNWVEALPRALRIHHDSVDPVTGMSPYQAVFGRTRNLAALLRPRSAKAESEDALEFFERMALVDQEVAAAREKALRDVADQVNARRRARPPYKVGDYVWLMKPKSVGGVKISTWWLGPYKVVGRVGQNSYQLHVPREGTLDAHASQLKFCYWDLPSGPVLHMEVPPKE
jgi:hypothetical protein